jgi:hypothetical protein
MLDLSFYFHFKGVSLRDKIERLVKNPIFIESAKSIKPSRTVWGISGILLFFILPEILAFWRGREIASWSHSHFLQEPTLIGRGSYWLLEKLFQGGGSYLNLLIGLGLLYWLLWDWKKEREESRS